MANKEVNINFGGATVGLLGVLFVGLKLGGVISWSWWWVTLPFWGGLVVGLGVLVFIFIFVGVLNYIGGDK